MKTINEIKAANKAAGFFYFEPDTMRFFDSRVESPVYPDEKGGAYFVTSEQFHGSQGSEPRFWTVRHCNSAGAISTARGFDYQEFDTSEDVHEMLERITA